MIGRKVFTMNRSLTMAASLWMEGVSLKAANSHPDIMERDWAIVLIYGLRSRPRALGRLCIPLVIRGKG
jgi:hypothetical protein